MIEIIRGAITKKELEEFAKNTFGDFVKAVIDIEKEIMAIGGEFHADEEIELMEKENSKRENTWGANLYPENLGEEFIEFNSMINIKPYLSNRSRGINDPIIQEKIRKIVKKLVPDT